MGRHKGNFEEEGFYLVENLMKEILDFKKNDQTWLKKITISILNI